MDDEKRKEQEAEEEKEKEKKRKQQAQQQQEEEEEEWKSGRTTSRAEVEEPEDESESQDDDDNRRDKDDKKQDEDNGDEDNSDNENENNDQDSNNDNNDSDANGDKESQNNDGDSNSSEQHNNENDSGSKSEEGSKNSDNGQSNNNPEDSGGPRNTREGSSSNDPSAKQGQGNKGQGSNSGNSNGNTGNSSSPSSGSPSGNPPASAPPGGGTTPPAGAPPAGASSAGASSAGASSAGASSAGASSAGASSAGASSASAVGSGGAIAGLGTVLLVILIIIIVLGILFFFITMPGLVVGKIGAALNSFFNSIENFFDGEGAGERTVTREEIVKAANYLENMGYDLQGYGFLDEDMVYDGSNDNDYIYEDNEDEVVEVISGEESTGFISTLQTMLRSNGDDAINPTTLPIENFSDKDAKERAEEEGNENIKQVFISKTSEDEELDLADDDAVRTRILMVKNLDGDVEFVRSKYLHMYVLAANMTYLVKNDNVDFGKRIHKMIPFTDPDLKDGVGMIYFTQGTDENGNKKKVSEYVRNWPGGTDDDFDEYFADPESGFFAKWKNRYEINPETKQMKIYNTYDNLFNTIFKTTYYTYNMSGWISQYGTPLQLSLTMHLASMAPDFAYAFAQNAVENTEVELGLVKIPNITVTLEYLMDLHMDIDGDGQEDGPHYYHLEKKYGMHMHTMDDGSDEEGYDSEDDAEADGEGDSDWKDEGEDVEGEYANLEEALGYFVDEMETVTNHQNDKQIVGSLIYKTSNGSNYSNDTLTFQYASSNVDNNWKIASDAGNLKDYTITNNNQYINKLQSILVKYTAKDESEPRAIIDGNKFKLVNDDSIVVNGESIHLASLISRYFRLDDIENSFYNDPHCKIEDVTNNGGYIYRSKILDVVNSSWDWDTILSNSEELYDEEDSQTNVYQYLYNVDSDNNEYYIWIAISKEHNYVCEWYNGSWFDTYYRSNMNGWYDIVFLGEQPQISKSIWDELEDFFAKYWPIRLYYRVLDEDDNVVKFSDEYFYTTGNHSYWKNDEGWFWRKSIPKELYNALNEAYLENEWNEVDHEEGESFDYTEVTDQDDATSPNLELDEVLSMLNKSYGSLGLNFDGINTKDIEKYLPIVLKVVGHWYQDLYYDDNSDDSDTSLGCYSYEENEEGGEVYPYDADDSDEEGVKKGSEAEVLYIREKSPGKIVQVAKPKTDKTYEFLDGLLDQEYYIYDGNGKSFTTEEDEDSDEGVKKVAKRKINFKDMSVDAIAMLEEIQGEDAQQIIRMFKLYMNHIGVTFETLEDTEYKKTICARVLDKTEAAFDPETNLLVEDNSSYVLRADIPPSQYGFVQTNQGKQVRVRAPVKGKVVYRADDVVCIEIDDEEENGKHDGYTILVSGFKVDVDIQEGSEVKIGDEIGDVKKQDLKMLLRDENGAIVYNKYQVHNDQGGYENEEKMSEYLEYDQHQGNVTTEVNGRRSKDDIIYAAKKAGFGAAEVTRIESYSEALVTMQDTYGIDPLWAVAVMHGESGSGLAYPGECRLFNIAYWGDQMIGYKGDSGGFATYNTYKDAILDFGNYSQNRFGSLLSTVDDYEEFEGCKLFENAKKIDYPIYLKLKTVLSEKGV